MTRKVNSFAHRTMRPDTWQSVVIHIDTPVIVLADAIPEGPCISVYSTQTMRLPGGHRLRADHSVCVAKQQNEPVRSMGRK